MRLTRAPALADNLAGATRVADRVRVTVTGEGTVRDAVDRIVGILVVLVILVGSKLSMVLTWTSQNPSPSSSRANSPAA